MILRYRHAERCTVTVSAPDRKSYVPVARACHAGTIKGPVSVAPNYTTKPEILTLMFMARGRHGSLERHVAINEAASAAPVTTTTATSSTTTTKAATAPIPSASSSVGGGATVGGGSGGGSAPAVVVKYAAVDPTFTQDPADALDGAWTFSADATETLTSNADTVTTTDLGAAGQLPVGVLNLFVDGLLACAMNVGGSVTGGTCPAAYSAYGEHTVVTQYVTNGTGIDGVTSMERVDISPFVTTLIVLTPTAGSSAVLDDDYVLPVTVAFEVNGARAVSPTGTYTLTGSDGSSVTCSSSPCTIDVLQQSTSEQWAPTIFYRGDINYAGSSSTGQGITIPAAPAPTELTELSTSVVQVFGLYDSGTDATTLYASVKASDGSYPVAGEVEFSVTGAGACTTQVTATGGSQNTAQCSVAGDVVGYSATIGYTGGQVSSGDAYFDAIDPSSTLLILQA